LCLLLKKVASIFCPSEARETSQIFSRTFQDRIKNAGLIQDVATLYVDRRQDEVWLEKKEFRRKQIKKNVFTQYFWIMSPSLILYY